MKNEGVVVLLVLLVAVGLAAGYIAGSDHQPVPTTYTETHATTQNITQVVTTTQAFATTQFVTTTETFTTTSVNTSTEFANATSTGGLQLEVGVNSTFLRTGQRLGITISLFNILPGQLNLSASNDWKVLGLPVAIWGDNCVNSSVEFMLSEGNLSLGQLQEASANSIVDEPHCLEPIDHLYGVVFEPLSAEANLTGTSCIVCGGNLTIQSLGLYRMETYYTVDGFWAYPINGSEASDVYTPLACQSPPCPRQFAYPEVGPIAQHPFIRGWYTLVVSDEWGQTVCLHFRVEN